jgi:uncharacterized membrane protein
VGLTRRTYLTVLSGAALWCFLLVAAPLAVSAGPPAAFAGEAVYRFFHPVCHQIPERSLQLAGHPLAVCARCSAIYISFLVGVLAFPLARSPFTYTGLSRGWIAAALAPMLADVAMGILGLHTPGLETRLLTGGVFGFAAAFAVLPPGLQAMREIAARRAPGRTAAEV